MKHQEKISITVLLVALELDAQYERISLLSGHLAELRRLLSRNMLLDPEVERVLSVAGAKAMAGHDDDGHTD